MAAAPTRPPTTACTRPCLRAIAKRLCPHAIFLSGDHELYWSVSREVHEILAEATPVIEPLALDEAFLDVTGSLRLLGEGTEIGRYLRTRIRESLDLSCSVGVAPNKFLAKLASVAAKPRALPGGVEPGAGVFEVRPGEERAFLHPLPVQKLWGVGPATLERLQRLGVHTVGDLAELGEKALVTTLGKANGRHLYALSMAEDDRPVESDRAMKSIGHEETFARDLHEPGELRTELVRLSDAVAAPTPARRGDRGEDADAEGPLCRLRHDHPVDDAAAQCGRHGRGDPRPPARCWPESTPHRACA